MWPRIAELLIAIWLAVSPFAFDSPIASDLTCAILIALFALLSFSERLNKMHLLTLLVATWLTLLPFFADHVTAAMQNSLYFGLFLLMLALVPSQAHLPPRPWRKFLTHKKESYGKKTR